MELVSAKRMYEVCETIRKAGFDYCHDEKKWEKKRLGVPIGWVVPTAGEGGRYRGDCQDYALLIWDSLRKVGADAQAMRICVVQTAAGYAVRPELTWNHAGLYVIAGPHGDRGPTAYWIDVEQYQTQNPPLPIEMMKSIRLWGRLGHHEKPTGEEPARGWKRFDPVTIAQEIDA